MYKIDTMPVERWGEQYVNETTSRSRSVINNNQTFIPNFLLGQPCNHVS